MSATLTNTFSPWPSFTPEEADAVSRVLLSNKVSYWTGEECRHFEREYAAWVGCRHAVALANGTVALEMALRALDIGPGDEVVVTPRTFLASVSCVITVGATPVFADVDPDSQNLTAHTIRAVLSPRTRAIICVHLAGWPCEMGPIMELARACDVKVIEDCAQANGALIDGRSVGTFGDINTWSFCQDKIITTGGEGGAVTTDDPALWSTVWSDKDHGKSWAAIYERQHPPGFRWVHESFGTNGRMLEVQAVIGRIQLKRMAEWTQRRTDNAARIAAALLDIPAVRTPTVPSRLTHAWYKFYAFVEPDSLAPGWTRERIVDRISACGVPCYSGICPEVYLERAFDHTSFRPAERLPVARRLGETSLMFLVHPTLTDAEMDLTCEVTRRVLSQAAS